MIQVSTEWHAFGISSWHRAEVTRPQYNCRNKVATGEISREQLVKVEVGIWVPTWGGQKKLTEYRAYGQRNKQYSEMEIDNFGWCDSYSGCSKTRWLTFCVIRGWYPNGLMEVMTWELKFCRLWFRLVWTCFR